MLFVVLTDFSIQICWKFDRLMKQPKLDSWKPGVTKKKYQEELTHISPSCKKLESLFNTDIVQ